MKCVKITLQSVGKMCSGSVLLFVALCVRFSSALTNNADLVWFEKDSQEPHNYFARQPIVEGLIKAHKIVVNQKFPVLWEVKFHYFDQLEELIIDNCGVNEIRVNTFKQLKPMSNLSIASNNIKEIKVNVFNNVYVKNLNLSHNRIAMIEPTAFDNMPILERIILDFNEIKKWNSDWFFNCTNIRTVSITHNFLEELPKRAFKNVCQQGEDNEINLYFGHNKIRDIDLEAFDGPYRFGDLFLDWNEIQSISANKSEEEGMAVVASKLIQVRHFDVSGDSLQCLSGAFLTSLLNKTRLLSIKDNPFECQCLQLLQDSVKSSLTKLELSQQLLDTCTKV